MKLPKSQKSLGLITAFFAATLMGLVGFFSRHINAQGDFIAFSRMACGAILFFFILLKMKRLSQLKNYKISATMVLSGVFMGACLSAYVAATQYTTIANAVFFIYIGPVISSVLSIIFLKEKVTLATISAITLVFIGMLLVVGLVSIRDGALHFELTLSAKTYVGDMLALASGIGYGLFLFFSRYRTDIPGDIRSFWNFVFALISICVIFLFTHPTVSQMTSSDWIWWIGIGIVCGFGALSLCTIATRNLLATEYACISYWECVFASVVGYVAFSESLTLIQGIGGLFIIIGGIGEIAVKFIKNMFANKVRQSAA